MEWINRHWGRNISAGIGAGFGYVDVDLGNDMTFEPFQGRVSWHVLDKVNLSVNTALTRPSPS